jgi:hypothetical protein
MHLLLVLEKLYTLPNLPADIVPWVKRQRKKMF